MESGGSSVQDHVGKSESLGNQAGLEKPRLIFVFLVDICNDGGWGSGGWRERMGNETHV